ncbi:MAG TPA: hypothetical protein PLX83_15125 [bacterium]|nr:hypothetical protein [bacterium]
MCSLPVLLAVFYIVIMTPLMGRKNGYTVDATPSFQLTRAIVATGDWFPPEKVKQGYVYSLVYIPFYAAGQVLEAWLPSPEPDWIPRKCLCWMNTVLTGLTVGLLAGVLGRLGYSPGAQAFVPLAYGFSTLAFAYARYDYNKCLAALLLLSAFSYAVIYLVNKNPRAVIGCGVAMGLLVTVRLEMAAAGVALFGVIALNTDRWAARRNTALAFWLPIGLGIGWVLLYNRIYWGSDLTGGYEWNFQWNPFPALQGFFFSPGKNIWFYNPVLLLLPLVVRAFKQRHPAVSGMWLGMLAAFLGVYSFWGNWWGGWAWGPRHLVPLLPLAVIPLAAVVDGGSRELKLLLVILAAAGWFIQFLGGYTDFNNIILTLMNQGVTEVELIWNPVWNPIVNHYRFLPYIPIQEWDYGWIGLYQFAPAAVFWALLILWCGTAAGLGYLIHKAVRRAE